MMTSESRLIDVGVLLEHIAELEIVGGHKMYRKGCDHMLHGFVPDLINAQPTINAIEVTLVVEMLRELFSDTCASKYCGNQEWLTLTSEICPGCGEHKDPLFCWKRYIQRWVERKNNE